MNIIYMKIQSYDDPTNSLMVSFASDTTKSQNPADYPVYAFQPEVLWPNLVDINEIKKQIALSGVIIAQRQTDMESYLDDPTKEGMLRASVGDENAYIIADIEPAPVVEPPFDVV